MYTSLPTDMWSICNPQFWARQVMLFSIFFWDYVCSWKNKCTHVSLLIIFDPFAIAKYEQNKKCDSAFTPETMCLKSNVLAIYICRTHPHFHNTQT